MYFQDSRKYGSYDPYIAQHRNQYGSYDPYIASHRSKYGSHDPSIAQHSKILDFQIFDYVCNVELYLDRTIHICSYVELYMDRTIHICSYVDVAGGRRGSPAAATATAAAATSQQLSHLARALDHHAQGPNIPFGVNPSLRRVDQANSHRSRQS